MRSGTLRQRVTLQERTETTGSTGEVTWSWADWATVWAAVEPISGRELFSAQQVQANTTTRIRIRHRSGVDSKLRVKFVADNGSPQRIKYYEIESVLHINERQREIHLMCVEREADGWRD